MVAPEPISFETYDALTRVHFAIFLERCFAEIGGGEPFLPNWHIHLIAAELQAAINGDHRFLAIAQPPRSLKSIAASVALPAWILGHNPKAKIICVSYGQQLAEELAYGTRQIMQSDWYTRLFPKTRLARNRVALDALGTTRGGRRFANSVEGSVTGFGADYIIIDDPTKPEEAFSEGRRHKANEWVRGTLLSRLNNKQTGRIICVMQRLHEDDVIGLLSRTVPLKLVSLSAIAQEDEHYRIPTPFGVLRHTRLKGDPLHAEREPLEALEMMRTALGDYFFAAQYLQMPAPPGGGIVNVDAFQRFDFATAPPFDHYVISWDTAVKMNELADYSVGIVFGVRGMQAYIVNVIRKKALFPELIALIKEQYAIYRPKALLIEDKASGSDLIPQLRYDGVSVQGMTPKAEKAMRMRSHTGKIVGGLVLLPTTAPWLDDFENELRIFPKGRYDDQVDALSQGLEHLFPVDGVDAWMRHTRERGSEGRHPDRMLRLNHPDMGRRFNRIDGDPIERDIDGGFSVNEEDFKSLRQVAGIQIIDV